MAMEETEVVREMAEGFIERDEDGKATYEALRTRGLEHDDARKEITKVLLGTLWQMEIGEIADARTANERMKDALERVRDGEKPETIFGERPEA